MKHELIFGNIKITVEELESSLPTIDIFSDKVKFDTLLAAIAFRYDVFSQSILGFKPRTTRVVQARWAFWYELHNTHGWSIMKIADKTNHNHGTIRYALRHYEQRQLNEKAKTNRVV